MLLRIYGKHFTAVPRIDGSLSSRRLASHHPAMASQNDRAECPIGVILDRSGQSCLPVHVRFAPKADLRLVYFR